jgi:hypothetical protein
MSQTKYVNKKKERKTKSARNYFNGDRREIIFTTGKTKNKVDESVRGYI